MSGDPYGYQKAAEQAFETHHDKRLAMVFGDLARYSAALGAENPGGISEDSANRKLLVLLENMLRHQDSLVHEVRFRLEGIESLLGIRYAVTPGGGDQIVGHEEFPKTPNPQAVYKVESQDGTLHEARDLLDRVLRLENHLGISPLKD